MRVLLRSISVLILVAAIVALIVGRDQVSRATAQFAPEIATVILAALLGLVLAASGRRADTLNRDAVLALTSTQNETPAPLPDTVEQRTLVAFTKSLLSVTTTEELRRTVEAQLTTLLQGRKVFITCRQPATYSLAADAEAPTQRTPALTADVQEWTTFVLRLDQQPVGLLGVESANGLSLQLKARIQSLTPLIAQALKVAQEIDVLREASVVDLLTGAATRREGLSRLQAEVKRAQRTGRTMAVLMIDLDHFKSINDRYGHALGDALLTAIGETMVRTLRASDVRCRWGGEEFLIVLPDTSLAQAQVVATHLLHNVAATVVTSAKGPVSSTASIGLTVSRPSESDANRLVGRADMALYQAKSAGRSCVRVVLGGFDGEPMAVDPSRNPPPNPPNETLPFPDRRNPNRSDRRSVPSPGRRRTDPAQVTAPRSPFAPDDTGEHEERKRARR